jgi:CheY-like chemotaxis protein
VAASWRYLAIREELRRRLTDGTYSIGQTLPSQPDLAREFGVSTMTMRQALAGLIDEGWLAVSQGRRTVVADITQRKPRVLVVDDEAPVREVLRATVEHLGYQVDEASDGYEALDRVAERSYDYIFLDLRMPGLDGITVLRRLHEIRGMARIIVVTGFVDDLLQLDPERDWPVTIIPKPFRLDQIRSVLAPQPIGRSTPARANLR